MAGKRHGAEEIIGKLGEAEMLMAKGGRVADAAKAIGVTEQSYYRWRRAPLGGDRSGRVVGALRTLVAIVLHRQAGLPRCLAPPPPRHQPPPAA
jgi:hypothetical protein